MKEITVKLMGAPAVSADGEERIFPYRKVEGLFYYICIKKRITREEAVGIFWADCDEQSARKNLRDALYHIKKILGPEVIRPDGNVFLSLNPDIRITVDVDQIRERILENYKGEFLQYFYVKNCLEFEDWMEGYRNELRSLYTRAAREAVGTAIAERDAAGAHRYALKLLEAFEQDERLYRKVMQFLMDEGEYSAAVALYQKLSSVLSQELDEEPEAETKALIEKVLELRRKMKEKPDRERLPFLGRERELYEIYDCIQGRLMGKERQPCNFVLVSGEAGVGKTALLSRIRAMVEEENYAVFSYSCCPAEGDLYLKPWNAILGEIQEYCRRAKKELVKYSQQFSEGNSDYHLFMTQYGIHLEELLQVFCREGGSSGAVIFLDDIQWMDPSSVQLLHNLLFHLKDCPLFVLAACRLETSRELRALRVSAMRESLLREIALKRFTLEETTSLIEAYDGEILGEPDNVKRIYRYTNGNALFLTELLKTMRESNEKTLKDRGLTSRTISIIEGRLSNLSDEEKELLKIMSLFQNEIMLEDIRILSTLTEKRIYDLLERLLERQIIVENTEKEENSYRFTHIILRDYINSKISTGRRRIYHREAAGYYEKKYQETGDMGLMPALVYHFENAGDVYKKYVYKLEYTKEFFSEKQEIYPSMSGSFLPGIFFPDTAQEKNVLISLVEEIRALPGRDRKHQELKMKAEYLMGCHDLSSGDYKMGLRNMRACIEAAKYLQDGRYLMDGCRQMIYYAIQVYDLSMMREYIDACWDLLQRFTYPAPARYMLERLEALYDIKMKEYGKAVERLDELIPKLEKLCRTDPAYIPGLTACFNYRGEVYMKREMWEEALCDVSRAVESCRGERPTAGLGMAYTNTGICLYQLGSYDKAAEYFAHARECFKDLYVEWGRTKEEVYSAQVELKLGRTKSALDHYRAACRYAGKDFSPNTTAMLKQVYGQLKGVPGLLPEEPPGT